MRIFGPSIIFKKGEKHFIVNYYNYIEIFL